ncbi:hypothetical protein U1Q18_029155 [Sarracenia purpurea var. burkii]
MSRGARQLGPSTSTTTTTTTTLTLDHPSPSPSSSSSLHQQLPPSQTLTLRLNRKTIKKKVSWKEGTVDNEFLQKKSSKKCCIFHKEKPFDEDDSEDDDGGDRDGNDHSNRNHSHDHGHDDGCCFSSNGGN